MRRGSRHPLTSVSAAALALVVVCVATAVGTPAQLTAQATATGSSPSRALPNQGPNDPRIPLRPSSTPPGNDTVGYWQQRADYAIVATLDERAAGIHAKGTLRYVNRSPDALSELWVHQHLNAFRPGSRWSAVDEREGRKRFQSLAEPDFAYERFTAAPRVNGVAVTPEYPLSPDSTVVRLPLATPLKSGDSLTVEFAWDARPATVPRRQGRRERSYDFAQWYPKVAVYDRLGWHPNALVPAGEFYGEYGTFDVTLVLPNDQVVGATGVPVEGDPGWARVKSADDVSPVVTVADAYHVQLPATSALPTAGHRVVRFYAEHVHHFAWSVSPGFRYESAVYNRLRTLTPPVDGGRGGASPASQQVPVHALYRADADDDCVRANVSLLSDTAKYNKGVRDCVNSSRTQWESGKAVEYGKTALRWLESVYGPYPYPQLTIVKRLDSGGTEFPMMMQNGSASLGLTLHEGGHIFTYGILGNNEWQSGWMDEGLTSYQTAWQQGDVRVSLAARLMAANDRDPLAPSDLALAKVRTRLDSATLKYEKSVKDGSAQPMGTRADLFSSFAVYNESVYSHAQLMYQALHDVLGDEVFQAFLHDYFSRWTFHHVDRWAMQGSAERVSKRKLDWFFDQWVNDVGTIDYSLRAPKVEKSGQGYMVRVRLVRVGRYRHPMPVGVRTAKGWTVVRGIPERDSQWLDIPVSETPEEVRLDPFGATDSQSARYYRFPLKSP